MDDPAKHEEVSKEHGSPPQKETITTQVEDLEPSDSDASRVKGGQVTPLIE